MLKIGITMNEELASRMDEYAADNYMSRSGVISLEVSLRTQDTARPETDLKKLPSV